MTKLVTGRVLKVPSANVSADRYEFLQISEAEPDLGLPSQLGQVFTSDLSGNRYWTRLDTANVSESPNNLYYTNERVMANVAVMSVGVFYDVNLANVSTGKALVWDDAANGFIPVYVNSEVANVADLSRKVLDLSNQTTANVREHYSNLYFTNTRVLDAISLQDINPQNVFVHGNAFIEGRTVALTILADSITSNAWVGIYTSNVVENTNQYFTNARTVQAVSPLLTTANVVESASNLYFTTARARESVSNSTGVYYSTDTGIFSIGQDVALTSDVQFRNLTISGNIYVLGNIATINANSLTINDPLLQVGFGNPADTYDLGWVGHYMPDGSDRHTGLFRDASDNGKFKFFANLATEITAESTNYIDVTDPSFEYATVVVKTLEGNVIGTVSSLNNHTTSALAEGQNLYYTNARVVQTVTPLLTTGNVVETTNQYLTNVRVLQAVNPVLTTANVVELDNLYFTNARVLSNVEQMSVNVFADVDISGVQLNATLVWDGSKFVPGSTDVSLRANSANTAGFANVALLADVANVSLATLFANVSGQVQTLSNFTTTNLAEGSNLYFNNTRARMAFTPGKGIAISDDGVIKNTGAPAIYSLNNDGATYGNISSALSNAIVFPSVITSNKFLLKSLLVTNLHNDTVYVSGNVLYATGNTATIVNRMPIHEGGASEFMSDVPQIFSPSDIIKLQGFNSAGTPTSNIMNYIATYESIDNSIDYSGVGVTIPTPDTNTQIYHAATAFAVFENIKLVNLTTGSVKVKLHWADANNNPLAYYVYNFPVPENSSVEILQTAKRINATDKLFVSYTGTASTNALSVFLSSRSGGVFTLGPQTTVAPAGNALTVAFAATEADGTTFYYTIE